MKAPLCACGCGLPVRRRRGHRGRWLSYRRGHVTRKLRPDQVRAIRASQAPVTALALEHRVSVPVILDVVHGVSYREVA